MRYVYISILLFITSTILAQWNTNTSINTPVCLALKSQGNIHTVIDTKGGSIITWDDNRNSLTNLTDIYAQRISNLGIAKWTANGVAVCTNTATQKSVSILDAGAGSAIITWEDDRAGNFDIYAQKIDSLGNLLWQIDGISVCSKPTNQRLLDLSCSLVSFF